MCVQEGGRGDRVLLGPELGLEWCGHCQPGAGRVDQGWVGESLSVW